MQTCRNSKKAETSEIQKPSTSRPSDPQLQDKKIPTTNPDTDLNQNEENPQDTVTPVIYPEIYPGTRSTASLETRKNPTEIQKQTFEELIPASSPIPDLGLDLDPALPLEENNFLDSLTLILSN